MRRFIVMGIVLFTWLCATHLWAQDSLHTKHSQPQPKITFSAIFHDFKTVGDDTTLTYTFAFRNEGQDTLRILRLKSG